MIPLPSVDIFNVDIDIGDFGSRCICVYNPVFSLRVALVAVFFTIMVIVPRLSGIRTEGATLYSVIATVGASAAETGNAHAARMRTAMRHHLIEEMSGTVPASFGIFPVFGN